MKQLEQFSFLLCIERVIQEHFPESDVEHVGRPVTAMCMVGLDPVQEELSLAGGYGAISKHPTA